MNSRERTFMALAHEEPDRPPISATYTPEASALLWQAFGRHEEDLGCVMGNDLIKTTVGVENSYYMYDTPTYVCPFGITWRNVTNATGAYTEIVDGALRNDDDGEKLRRYQIPNPDDPALYTGVRNAVEKYGKEKFIIGSCQCSIFETAWYLHGMDAMLTDMAADEDYANALFDKIMEFPLKAGLHMIEAGVDMVWLGDDVATQRNMMISMPMWRKYFKSRYAEIFEAFRRAKKDIVIAYHSCGNCTDILDELADILPSGTLEDQLDAKALGKSINAFLDTLSSDDRVLFVRRYWFGDSVTELAKQRLTTTGNLSVRLHRIRQKLKYYLNKEGFFL